MIRTARLAGFFGAHGVWCVCDGETLIPMVGFERQAGEREMLRFATELLENAVAEAKAWVEKNPQDASRAVAVYDGYLTLSGSRTDALFVEATCYETKQQLHIAVPYRPPHDGASFAVYRPKILAAPEHLATELVEAFWEGIGSHEDAAKVWNDSIDQSR